jgi:phosphate uptake regulator
MEQYKALRDKVLAMEKDAEKAFTKGNKSAAVRLRKECQDVKRLAQDLRNSTKAIAPAEAETQAAA